jgi:SAM-dependent methyltransferase
MPRRPRGRLSRSAPGELDEAVNENHAQLCPSPEWAAYLQGEVLPAVTDGVDLGSRMLEIGPGPGAATDWLRTRVAELVAIEIEDEAAEKLRARFPRGNVEVVTGDAARLPWEDASFDSVASFTMLHHVPTRRGQDQILAEALRVLRPGGVLIASDSVPGTDLHGFHSEDTYNPIEPATLIARLQTIGYGAMTVSDGHAWTVRAFKDPASPETWE